MSKNNDWAKIVSELKQLGYTIATMESCTGGYIASCITNVSGSSDVFNFGATTYGTDYKIKLGVNPQTVEKYTVFSTQVAKEMAKSICKYSDSNIGIGVTGNLNLNTDDGSRGGEVYTSIYNKNTKQYSTKIINLKCKDREKSKTIIASLIATELVKLLAIQGE